MVIQRVLVGQVTEVSPDAPLGANRWVQVAPPSVDWMIWEPTATQSVVLAQVTARRAPIPWGMVGLGCQVEPVLDELTITALGAKFELADWPTARHWLSAGQETPNRAALAAAVAGAQVVPPLPLESAWVPPTASQWVASGHDTDVKAGDPAGGALSVQSAPPFELVAMSAWSVVVWPTEMHCSVPVQLTPASSPEGSGAVAVPDGALEEVEAAWVVLVVVEPLEAPEELDRAAAMEATPSSSNTTPTAATTDHRRRRNHFRLNIWIPLAFPTRTATVAW